MSQNVDIYETGLSSGASTPRHGASPSPAAAEIQWYEYDLQLAAELGKALLERNQDLESQLADAEKTIQSQQTEIQFLFQKLDTAKNLNESRMRIFEQVDTNAQDLEAVNRQLRHQSSIDQQTISRLTGSLREAESRCEKLENDVYDMKREMAEEAKRFRDRWRETKKKERRASNESMESDVDADDFILLGDVVHDKKIPSASARRDENVEDRIFDDLNVETSLVDSLSWYQAETERLNKEKASLIPLKGSLDLSDDKASFMVQPVYVIQNHDFYPIHLRSLTVAVTLSGVQVALSTNSTKLTVPIRGTVVVPDKVRITIGTSLEVYVLFCKDPRDRVHQFFMRLEVTATGETLGGSVTVIYENYSRVFCNYNTGNSGGILR